VLLKLAINFHFYHGFKRFIDTRGPPLSNDNASAALEAVVDKELNLSQNHVLFCLKKIVATFKAKFMIFINHTKGRVKGFILLDK